MSTLILYQHKSKKTNECLYIGIGRDYRATSTSRKYDHKAWMKSDDCIVEVICKGPAEDIKAIEAATIQELQPKYNIQYTDKEIVSSNISLVNHPLFKTRKEARAFKKSKGWNDDQMKQYLRDTM